MRIALVVILSLLGTGLLSQDIVVRSFVKSDTLQLRWAPTTMKGLETGLRKGYTIRNETQQFVIGPFIERRVDYDNHEDEFIRSMSSMISAYLDNPGGEQVEMLYALWMLRAGPDRRLAQMLGVYFESTEATSGSYQILIPETKIQSPEMKVDKSTADSNPELTELVGESRSKLQEVYLKWEVASLEYSYSGYDLEKSEDSVNFVKPNKDPLIFFRSQDEKDKIEMDFVDTLVEEGQTYFYRVRGINHFGDPGAISNVVKVYVPRSLVGECRIDTVYSEDFNRRVKGRFLYNNDSDIENLDRFALYRSDSMFLGYQQINEIAAEKNLFEYTYESDLLTGDCNYFRVAAISKDADTTWSYPYYYFTLDQEPPSKPTGLKGVVNDSGIVSLSWTPNPEQDIRGYRVFRSNSLKEEFVEIVSDFVIDSVHFDTLSLRNLTSQVYYKISAVDLNYNNSDFSEIVKLQKPDTIPPVKAVFKKYHVDTAGISIEWINSSSRDLDSCLLIRSFKSEKDTVATWEADSMFSFQDHKLSNQGQYQYSIVSIDKSQNKSISKELTVQYELGYRKLNDELTAEVDREQKQIKLSWEINAEDIYSLQLYRKKNDGGYKLVSTLRSDFDDGYIDENLPINNKYSYRMQIMYKSGISSKMSKPVEVVY